MKMLLAGLFALLTALPALHASDLANRLAQIDVKSAGGEVGIGVLDLSTGESWYHNGNKPFPMQSVVKFPVAVAILSLVDAGVLTLEQQVEVTQDDVAPAWSPLRDALEGGSGTFTVRKLLEESVSNSDNTAVDVLIKLAGGTNKVQGILTKLGVRDVRVDRPERELQTEGIGIRNFESHMAAPEKYEAAAAAVSDEDKRAALTQYLSDPRDTATPEGMTHLLKAFHEGKLLTKESTGVLMDIMRSTPHGKDRLKGGLPADWTLAHKTGTGPDLLGTNFATNDVGIACAPDGHCYALAVFVAGSKAPIEAREQLMRQVAEAVR
jgi:beta-lactamase class A